MMKFDVDDVPTWYLHVKKVLASEGFSTVRVSEPETAATP
jgi:hypothetical protein